MKLTEFAVRNPLVILAVTAAIVIFGAIAYARMGVAITPNVNFPSVVVTTVYPGADPETVETNVTTPIEDAIAGLPNIDKNGLTSVSTQGISIVGVQFTTAANPDLVSVDVERVVTSARNNLPPDADPPTVTKIDINAFGVATVVLSGQQELTTLQDVAENVIQKQFNAVPGVGSTSIRSGIVREIHVVVDEAALKARDLTINTVIAAIQSQQVEVPAGTISQDGTDFSVYFDSLAHTPQQLGNIVVLASQDGSVYLRDVAHIEETYKKRSAIVRVNGQEGIALVVTKLADANTIAVVDGLKQTIERLTPQLPPNTSLDVVIDSSTYTARSFTTVQRALLEAVLATGLILLIFLHTWRSTLIVLIAIPTSLLSTLILMHLLDYNLNLLTMMALTLSVGILVDDSIVVLENIYRHFHMGKPPRVAAIDGRSEIGLAAVTITFVDVVVYVPIAIMLSGVAAQFLRPFALTIAFSTLASLLVSFTLTPLLASRFLARDDPHARTLMARFGRIWDAGFMWLERRYEWLLRHALPHRWIVIVVGLASFVFGISLWTMGLIGSDFFPSGDQSELDITLTLPPASSLDTTDTVTKQIETLLRSYPEVTTLYTVVGASSDGFGGGTSTNQSQITALLVPAHERAKSSAQLADELRPILVNAAPSVKVQIGRPNAFGFGGFGGQPIQVLVQGQDPQTVNQLAETVEEAVRNVPGAVSVRNSNENVQPQLRVTVDWRRAADLGVTVQNAGVALRTAIDGWRATANQFKRPGQTSIDIRVLTAHAGSLSVSDIAALPIAGTDGQIVQLGQIATIEQVTIPTSIRHVNRLRSVTVSTEPGEGKLVGDVQAAVQRAVAQVPMPAGYSVSYAGQGEEGGSAFSDIFAALGVAVVLMYMLMMMLFGSLVLPLAVLMSLPLAVVGAFGAMALTHTPFTLFSLLGFAVLVGLVGKNAILLVDYTEILQSRGYDRTSALLAAGPVRLRPIVMTTLSVMVALLPIASGVEAGSELLQAAAVVLIGGLLTSTLLTLVFVPAMFTIFDDAQNAVLRLFRRSSPTHAVTRDTVHPAPAPGPNGAAGRETSAPAPADKPPTPGGEAASTDARRDSPANGRDAGTDGRDAKDSPQTGASAPHTRRRD
ncbi:MAG: efflux RND transporter permease subunit [Chloroflexi bacterium]|nr:efflux RND transporter permease subunit [Chloroflexota bacterium]